MKQRERITQFHGDVKGEYTPGPWHTGKAGLDCARGHAIASGPIVIAIVLGNGYPIGKGWAPSSQADANLIAAAPELLEMLEDLLPVIQASAMLDAFPDAIDLIMRAKGVDPATARKHTNEYRDFVVGLQKVKHETA